MIAVSRDLGSPGELPAQWSGGSCPFVVYSGEGTKQDSSLLEIDANHTYTHIVDILTKLSIFLVLFALIVFGSKLLLSKKTREALKGLQDPVPTYIQSQNRFLARMIIILVTMIIALYIVLRLR